MSRFYDLLQIAYYSMHWGH